jgi:hypothetical protein
MPHHLPSAALKNKGLDLSPTGYVMGSGLLQQGKIHTKKLLARVMASAAYAIGR